MNSPTVRRRRSIHDRDSDTPIAETPIYVESKDEEREESGDSDEDFDSSRPEPRTPPSPLLNRKKPSGQSRDALSPERANASPLVSPTISKRESGQGKGNCLIYVVVLVTAIVAVVIGVGVNFNTYQQPRIKICSYDKLRSAHPKQDESVWRILRVGIENILNERTDMPGVYLFVHQGGENVNKLVKAIALQSSSCFGLDMSPLEMDSNDFTSKHAVDDYGYAIQKYKKKIKEGRVILIANLNEIPAEAARALHVICDTYSPIAKDVMIFLTLVTTTDGRAIQRAQDTLFELWGSTLKSHELDPLITRVTDQVISLRS